MADRTVNVRINYVTSTGDLQKSEAQTKKADAATQKLRKSTQDFGKSAQQAGKESTQAFSNVGKNVQGLDKDFQSLTSTVKSVFAALAVKEIANMGLEFARVAGNVEGVEKAFQRLPNSTRLMGDLRTATKGTVSDLQLMQTAIKARNFEIPLDKLGTLLQFASIKAQQTGESVDYLVDSIVTGIGRESPLILDNLQIKMTAIKKVMKESGVALGDAVGIVAQQQIKEMGDQIETGATKVAKLETSWTNLYKKIAEGFYSAGIDKIIDKVTVSIGGDSDEIVKKFNINKGLIQQFTGRTMQVANDFQGMMAQALQNTVEDLNSRSVEILGGLAKTYYSTFGTIQEAFDRAGLSSEEATKVTYVYIQALIDMQNQSALAGKAERERFAEQLRQQNAHRSQMEFEKKHTLEIFKLTVAEQLHEKATKDGAKAMEDLAASLKKVEEILPDVASGITIEAEAFDELTDAQIRSSRRSAEWAEAWQEMKKDVAVSGIDILKEQLQAEANMEVDSLEQRLESLKSFYDEQQLLAGDNERAKIELRIREKRDTEDLHKEIAKAEKKARRNSVIIDTAAGIMKAFATAATIPQAIIQAAIVTGVGLSQLAIIERQKFARGGININGPGTSTSDSIPAMLSRGESVMTAEETRRSMGILKGIRAKKIDDNVMKQLQLSGSVGSSFSDNRIVSELQATRVALNRLNAPDIIKDGRHLYEVRQKTETYRQKVRRKSM